MESKDLRCLECGAARGQPCRNIDGRPIYRHPMHPDVAVCATCGVRPGQPCVGPSLKPARGPHKDHPDTRWEAAGFKSRFEWRRQREQETSDRYRYREVVVPVAAIDVMGALRELGLGLGATSAQVQAAFRRLAHVRHPDHGGDAEAFKRLVAARDVIASLGERVKRDGSVTA